jgi:hypothetical protein
MAQEAPAYEEIHPGDIVRFSHHDWDVRSRRVVDATTDPPTVELVLDRVTHVPIPGTTRTKKQVLTKRVSELRVQLLARQPGLFS